MPTLNHTFGDISKEQFSSYVHDFLNKAENLDSIESIDQGIKTLSIMYVSIDLDEQPESLEDFKKAIQFQIDFERSHNQDHKFNNDSVDDRSELSIDMAISHELIC